MNFANEYQWPNFKLNIFDEIKYQLKIEFKIFSKPKRYIIEEILNSKYLLIKN